METFEINNRRYLGSKYKLTEFIKKIVNDNCLDYESFFDVFAGTGIVGSAFNKENIKVIVNDLLLSNFYSYNVWFSNEDFRLSKIVEIIYYYNSLILVEDNYFSLNFSNTYFSKNVCRKIGFIREDIEKKYNNSQINLREKYILITSLIYSIDKIANTVGHYDAYRKKSDYKDNFKIAVPNIPNNSINKSNLIFNQNANLIIRKIKSDIVYIDPPYNSRQYSDAYHLLENIAKWNKPRVYGIAKKMDRSNLKSDYCTSRAGENFADLIKEVSAKYILVSYNNMGDKGDGRSHAKITDKEITEILGERGKVQIFEKDFNYFSTGKTKLEDHKERVFFCKVGEKSKFYSVFKFNKNSNFIKSPLNYVGGKFKLLDQIAPIFPKKINYFIDMFCGGCNIGLNVIANNIVCVDKQIELIRVLKLLKTTSYPEVVKTIESIIYKYNLSNTFEYGYKFYNCDSSKGLGDYNKSAYIKLRNDYNLILKNSKRKDYLLITLIIYSFNHQIRFNLKNNFNMPVGKRDFNNSIRKNLFDFCKKLEYIKINFVSGDFKKFNYKLFNQNDFFYFDPPYYLGTASYNENYGWNSKSEIELLNYIDKINSKKIKFALSNVIEHKGVKHDILLDWAIKNQYEIKYLKYNYNNSNYHLKNKEGKTSEVLITNY